MVAEPKPALAAEPPRPRAEAPPVKRYKAFISYSWADKAWGAWAHKALETYKTPKVLAGKPGLNGPVPASLAPIFKDREEEAAGAGITASIEAAMAASDFLIVICSPASAQSKWVNHEIAWYKTRRDPSRVLALVVDGEPGASFIPGREAEECFPKALLYKIGPDLQPTDEKEDVPLAADARKAGDGKRAAKLKLAAAMLGLGLDDLVRRDERRRTIRRRLVTAALVVFSSWMTANTWFAVSQRNEARAQRLLAEQQTENVNAALGYLVSLFEIANPATENPKTITALTVLARGLAKLDVELADKPMVRTRLLSTIGEVYQNLGEIRGAEPILAKAAQGPFASLADEVAARMQYADALTRLSEFAKAEKEIRITTELVEKAVDSLSPEMISIYRSDIDQRSATLAYHQSNYELTIAKYLSAKELCQSSILCESEALASISNNLSIAYSESGRVEEARRELLFVREIYLKEFGPDHLKTAITNQNIAYVDFQNKQLDAALATMPGVVATFERVLEDNHPYRAAANVLLGRLHYASGDGKSALAALSRALSVYTAAYGADHEEVAYTSLYRALAAAKAGRRDEAFLDLARAESIYRKKLPPDDANFGDVIVHEGFVLAELGEAAAAGEACRRGLEHMANALSASDSWLASTRARCEPIIAATGG